MRTDDEIEKLADSFRKELGIEDELAPDMMALLASMRDAGKILSLEIIRDETLGQAEARYDGKNRSISVSQSCAEGRRPQDRFTIAHEIGHYLAGHEGLRNRRSDHGRQFGKTVAHDEIEANKIAAAVLIPERLAAVDLSTTPESLASRFGVSLTMAQVRLATLQERYRKLHSIKRKALRRVMLGANGQIVYEPVEGFDSGDYDAAFPEMLKNAMRSNR